MGAYSFVLWSGNWRSNGSAYTKPNRLKYRSQTKGNILPSSRWVEREAKDLTSEKKECYGNRNKNKLNLWVSCGGRPVYCQYVTNDSESHREAKTKTKIGFQPSMRYACTRCTQQISNKERPITTARINVNDLLAATTELPSRTQI